MLKNAPTLAIGGVDTEENEHCKVCPLSVYRSPRYKMVPQLDKCIPNGVPSLKDCKKLTVKGEVVFTEGTIFVGEVTVKNTSSEAVTLPKGTYKDTTIELPA